MHLDRVLGLDLRQHLVDQRLDPLELFHGANLRHHDFRVDVDLLLNALRRRFQNGADLHLVDFGVGQAETDAAVAEHRVDFVQGAGFLQDLFFLGQDVGDQMAVVEDAELLDRLRIGLRQQLADRLQALRGLAQVAQMLDVVHQGLLGGQELVDRRIEQADRHRPRSHDPQDFLEVATLHRQQLGQGRFAVLGGLGQNHLQHDRQAFLGVEHALGAAQADAHRAVVGGALGRVRGIGVGHDLERGDFIGPAQQGAQFGGEFRLDGGDFA